MIFNALIILVNCILTCMGLEISLEVNETGRYLYRSQTNPQASRLYCTYCPDDLSSQDVIDRNQEEECSTEERLTYFENDIEEMKKKLYPFCKQAVGIIPGCGPIPFKEGLLFEGRNSDFLNNNKSRVYEVYTAKCVEGYLLNSITTEYRCGEDRKWNIDPYGLECLVQSGTGSEDLHNNESTYIIIALSILVVLVFVIVGLAIRKRKLIQKICCYRSNKNSNSIELQSVSRSLVPVDKYEQSNGACLTDNVVNNTVIYNEIPTREDERKCLSSSGQKDKDSYLKVSPALKISGQGQGQGHCYKVLEERGEPDGLDVESKEKKATNVEHTEDIGAQENDEEELESKNGWEKSKSTHGYFIKDNSSIDSQTMDQRILEE